MPIRRSLALLLTAATMTATSPAGVAAQATESQTWNFCFTSAIGSCSVFSLTTAASFDAFGNRHGTLVDVLATHLGGNGIVSGLASFTFYGINFGGTSDSAGTVQLPVAEFGAPAIPVVDAYRWKGRGLVDRSNPTDPYGNFMSFYSEFTPGLSQFIGGCLGGDFDGMHQSVAVTCGANAAYRFGFTSSVQFDASDVSRIALDVYAGDYTGDFVPDGASCNAATDGTTGYGIDAGDQFFTGTCVVGQGAIVSPEPESLTLLATGLVLFTGAGLRRRLRKHYH